MAIRTKTKRRLLVLLIVVVAVVGAAGGIYTLRMRQIREEIARKRTEGMSAFEKGDYFSALHALGTYVNRSGEPDVEALYKYSQARQKVEEPNAKHLLLAAGTLRHVLGLKPGHVQARRDLLDLHIQLGYSTEAIETADSILRNDPNDLQALRAKTIALTRLRKLNEALELSERYNQLKPLELDGHTLTFSILRRLERPADDWGGRARDLHEAHPDDPRTEWLMAYAYGLAGDREKEAEWCRAAAGHDDLEPEVAIRIVGLLDHLGESQEAFELLKRAAGAHDDPQIQRRLAKRLWENQDFGQLIERFSGRDDATAEADSEVLGLLVMSLIRAGRQEEAGPFVDALSSRKGDNMAAAWAHVLKGVFLDADQDPFRLIKVWQEALERVPSYPYFTYFLANTYAAIGETDRALSFYSLAARAAPAWRFPLIEAARQLLAAGRSKDALQLAREVVSRGARRSVNLQEAVTWAEVWHANLRDRQDQDASKLLERVNEILGKVPNEPHVLPIQVDLLARTGEITKAQGVVKSVVESESAPSQGLLLRLAEVSHARKLGLEDECLQRCKKAHGMTPAVAFALAQQEYRAGRPKDGVKILEDAQKKDAPSNSKQWQVTLAQYLELINDDGAREAWVRLAEAFPADPQIQRLVLKARSVWPDRGFVDKTIDRLKELVGDDSTSWRLPRARWLMRYDTSERGVKQAAELLADVVRSASDRADARLLLAECERQLGNLSGAVEHLTAVVQRRPDLVDIQLKLASLQQRQGDTKAARSTIDQALRSGADDPNHIRGAAALLAAQGDTDQAIAAMRRLYPESETPADLLLASLYSRRNDPEKRDPENATAICEKLMEKPDLAAVRFVAGFYASRGEQTKAKETLAHLAKLDLKPGVRELVLGNHQASYGNADPNADPNADAALAHYQKAIKEAPDNPVAHRLVIAAHIQRGEPDQAVKAIEEAARRCPDDPAIRFAQQHEGLLGLTEKGVALRPLASALVQVKSQRTAAADFLQVIQEAKDKGQGAAEVIHRLRQLADRQPRFWPGQAFLVDIYRRIGRPNEAAELAARAMQAFPVAPEPAWLAAESLAAAGRWAEALSVANEWRRRSAGQPVGADLIIAEAQIQLGQPGSAAARLQPHLGEAMKDPDANVHIIVRYTRAMILTGQIDRAAALWAPLLKKSSNWRQGWMHLGLLALPDAASAANWLNRVVPLIPQDALEEKVALAQSWRMVDERFRQTDYTKQARGILSDVTTRPDPPADAFQLLAMLDEHDGKHAAAEDGYRKALERDPNVSLSANNLAMIVLQRNGDLDEALELASRAVKIMPRMAAYHDTLAQVQAKRGEYDAAIKSIGGAIKLQPNNLESYVRLVHIFIKAARIKDAREVLTRIDQVVPDPTRLPSELKESLSKAREDVTAAMEKAARVP